MAKPKPKPKSNKIKTKAQKEQATRDKPKTALTTLAGTAAIASELFSPNSIRNSLIPPTSPMTPTEKSSTPPRKLSQKRGFLSQSWQETIAWF